MIYFIFVHQGTNDVMDITQMTFRCRNDMYVFLGGEAISFYLTIFKPKCLVSNIQDLPLLLDNDYQSYQVPLREQKQVWKQQENYEGESCLVAQEKASTTSCTFLFSLNTKLRLILQYNCASQYLCFFMVAFVFVCMEPILERVQCISISCCIHTNVFFFFLNICFMCITTVTMVIYPIFLFSLFSSLCLVFFPIL